MTQLANKHHSGKIDYQSLPSGPTYAPIKDDLLAARFAPKILSGSEHGDPSKLFYRASRYSNGDTLFAYHFVWPHQKNNASGFGAFLTRALYSGGPTSLWQRRCRNGFSLGWCRW